MPGVSNSTDEHLVQTSDTTAWLCTIGVWVLAALASLRPDGSGPVAAQWAAVILGLGCVLLVICSSFRWLCLSMTIQMGLTVAAIVMARFWHNALYGSVLLGLAFIPFVWSVVLTLKRRESEPLSVMSFLPLAFYFLPAVLR